MGREEEEGGRTSAEEGGAVVLEDQEAVHEHHRRVLRERQLHPAPRDASATTTCLVSIHASNSRGTYGAARQRDTTSW